MARDAVAEAGVDLVRQRAGGGCQFVDGLVFADKLDLDARVHGFFPAFSGPAKESVTVRHLLTHSGGLQWWAPLYKELKTKDAYLDRVVASELVYDPGSKSVYSDLGVFLLGEILERVAGRPLEEVVRERLFAPLGMRDTGFRPPAALLPRIAATDSLEALSMALAAAPMPTMPAVFSVPPRRPPSWPPPRSNGSNARPPRT